MQDFEKIHRKVYLHWWRAIEAKEDELATDYAKTLSSLETHKIALKEEYEAGNEKITKKTRVEYSGNGILTSLPPISLPELFINDKPAKKLFIYGIKEFLKKNALIKKFNELNIFDFQIEKYVHLKQVSENRTLF